MGRGDSARPVDLGADTGIRAVDADAGLVRQARQSAADQQIRICLSMIVRNERATIERCLDSALPLLSAAVLCDTGSTDGTPDIAADVLARHGVPFEICHHEWEHFGANRTRALHEAGRFVEGQGWRRDSTYWLLLDADLELTGAKDFDPDSLQDDAIVLRQRTGPLSYWTLRLARASRDWSAVGRAHERYSCPDIPPFTPEARLTILDHADGGSKVGKFGRDIAWLSEQLEETPGEPRTLFHLAQTYLADGNPLKALLLHRRRAAIQDGSEEAWYSMFMVGRILAEANHLVPATDALLAAHSADPDRAEPLYELARLHRRHSRRTEAADFADRASRMPFPEARRHFVHADVYEYQCDAELAHSAMGTPLADRGFDACERLVLSRDVPAKVVDEARVLTLSYVESIKGMEFLPVRPPLPASYRPCNPSILRTDSGYLVNCRAVNYEQHRLRFRSRDGDGIYRSRNALIEMDDTFAVTGVRDVAIDEPTLREESVEGLEDCRLVKHRDAVYFTCVTSDRHPSGHIRESICRLDVDGSVIAHHPLTGVFDDRPQKNWLPFNGDDGELLAIYGYDPVTVLRLSTASGHCTVVHERHAAFSTAHWRGSAGPTRWPDGRPDRQFVLVHEAIHRPGPDQFVDRVYLHRFVEFDNAFAIKRLSRPFVFVHKGIEFACGMTTSHDGQDLIIGFGVEDRDAYLGRISLGRVDTLLDARHAP